MFFFITLLNDIACARVHENVRNIERFEYFFNFLQISLLYFLPYLMSYHISVTWSLFYSFSLSLPLILFLSLSLYPLLSLLLFFISSLSIFVLFLSQFLRLSSKDIELLDYVLYICLCLCLSL